MQQQAQRSSRYASALSLALSCAGCLITNELDFEPNVTLPRIVRLSPPELTRAPSEGSPECEGRALSFRARYFDDDVDQDLTVLPVLNGSTLPMLSNTLVSPPGPDRTAEHEAPLICVPLDLLRGDNCNIVRVFVADDRRTFERNLSPEQLLDERDVDSLTWYLGPQASESPGRPPSPDVSFTDCLPPIDGGV
jgi:hypothetical protein